MLDNKGLEISIIGMLIIGIVGILILFIFVQGPLTSLMRDTFCYFLTSVLQQKSSYCPSLQTATKTETVAEDTVINLARKIAAYAITCWNDERPVVKKQIACFNLNLAKNPGPVYEYNVTKIMEDEKGCPILQNSKIVDENGNTVPYPGICGSADQIDWRVSGNAITDQKLILIIYDATIDKIIIQA